MLIVDSPFLTNLGVQIISILVGILIQIRTRGPSPSPDSNPDE